MDRQRWDNSDGCFEIDQSRDQLSRARLERHFPAIERSRSNQGSATPSVDIDGQRLQPKRLTDGFGRTDRLGLSVWAPTSRNPSDRSWPAVNAIKLESFRTVKYLPPTTIGSRLTSLQGAKPAASSCSDITPPRGKAWLRPSRNSINQYLHCLLSYKHQDRKQDQSQEHTVYHKRHHPDASNQSDKERYGCIGTDSSYQHGSQR